MSPQNKVILRIGVFLLVLMSPLSGQNVVSVCASGCDYSSLSNAIAAAQEGTILELAAGETFIEPIHLVAARNLTIRSSRWRELPPSGHRINPVLHAPLLATIQTTNESPALLIGPIENAILMNGVDVQADTITFDYAPPNSSFSNGAAIVCRGRTDFNASLPAPMVRGRKYWVRDYVPSLRRGRLAETPDGPALNLVDVGSSQSSSYYDRPACVFWEQPEQIKIRGIRFATTPGVITRNLVQVGNNTETDPTQMGPKGIEIRHSVITGIQNQEGPLVCLALFGGHDISVQDSWLGHCKQTGGNESKAIGMQNVAGALIRNNYLSAASINLLTAGADSASGEVNRDLVITGNFFEKQGYMMYKEGVGPPAGECYFGGGSGAFYRRTDVTPNTCVNGACYTCQENRTWNIDTAAYYRPGNYLTKNLLEFKDCEDCQVEGNYFVGSYAGPDGGQGGCFGVAVGTSQLGTFGFGSGYHRAKRVSFRNNWADYCYSGVFLVNSSYNSVFEQTPIQDLTVDNNLFSNLGAFPVLSQWPTVTSVQRYSFKQSTGVRGVTFTNNTFRGPGSEFGMLLFKSPHEPADIRDSQIEDNIFRAGTYSLLLDNSSSDCSSGGLFKFYPYDGAKRFRNNLFYGSPAGFLTSSSCVSTIAEHNVYVPDENSVGFAGPDNHRLMTNSPFSADNVQSALLSVNGTSVGADVEVIEQYTIPARLGVPPMPELLQLQVTPGSRAALLSFRRADAAAACSVTLYSSMGRIAAHEYGDTNTEERKLDIRSSSIFRSGAVQFAAGSELPLSPETWYSYRVDCGSITAVGRFRTFAAMGSTSPVSTVVRHETAFAAEIEYASEATFSNPITAPAVFIQDGKANVTVELPSGINYWRVRFLDSALELIERGPISIAVAP